MDLFGTTRSRFRRSHALIAPDSFVTSDLPGWERSQGIIRDRTADGGPVHAVPRDDGARRHRGPAAARRRAGALRARRSGRRDAAGLGPSVACGPAGSRIARRTPASRCARWRRRASTSSRSGTPSRPGYRGPRLALRRRAGGRGHAVPGRSRTRSSRSCCRATRGSTSPSTCSRFGPGRRCPWSRFT